MAQTLDAAREAMTGAAFMNATAELGRKVFMTPQLRMVVADVHRLHQDVAALIDPNEPFAPGNRKKVGALSIIGPSGSSKSFSIEYALETLPSLGLLDGTSLDPKILSLECPPLGTSGGLLRELVGKLSGSQMTRPPAPDAASSMIAQQLKRRQLTMLSIEELSRVLNPRIHTNRELAKEAEIVWAQVMSIIDDSVWPTPVIVSGLPFIADTLSMVDPRTQEPVVRAEMLRRGYVSRLAELSIADDSETLEAYVAQYCELASVTHNLRHGDALGARLVHASRNAIGTALVLAQRAVALAALRRRGALSIVDFAHVYSVWTSCSPDSNVFLSPEWPHIDMSKIAPKDFNEARYLTNRERNEEAY
jgi:hypothetical protein